MTGEGKGDRRGDRWLLARAALAILALPGVVAFIVPLALLRPTHAPPLSLDGASVAAAGCLVVLRCVRDFYVAGRGTLAPWSPPRHLVRVGLYRISRNPMYVGVLLIVAGWALGFRSPALALYDVALAIAFHLRVTLSEEPWLARRYGGEWEAYRGAVRRWL